MSFAWLVNCSRVSKLSMIVFSVQECSCCNGSSEEDLSCYFERKRQSDSKYKSSTANSINQCFEGTGNNIPPAIKINWNCFIAYVELQI